MMDKKADKGPITHEAIERLLRVREKIIEETGGQIMEDSAEAVREAREERTWELMGEPGERKPRPVTRETVESLRKIREEIFRERGGKLFEDSAKLIDEMRDERTRQLMQAITGQYEYDEELNGEQL